MQNKISIITPSFNQGDFIEQTILSVISQNYTNLEYIIIDGGSNDNTVEVIKKHEKHLTYWVSEKDRGQSHALNKGFKKATGDIIAWINSDDMYLPETFDFIVKMFKQNPDVDIIYGDVINFSETKENYYKVKEFEPLDFLSRISIHQPGVFWRRKLLGKVGLLDETLHYSMDYDLWMRLFFNYKSLKIDKPFAKFRMHEKSKTTGSPPELYLDCRIVLSKFFNSLNSNKTVNYLKELDIYYNPKNKKYNLNIKNTSFLPKAIKRYIYNFAIEEYTFGNKDKANKLFWISLKKGYLKSLYFLIKQIYFKQ